MVVEGLLGIDDSSDPEIVPVFVSDVPLPVVVSEDPDRVELVVDNPVDSAASGEDIAFADIEIRLDVEAPGAVDTAG